jgi:hypothetical protein
VGKIKQSVRVRRKEKYGKSKNERKERGKEEYLGRSDVVRELLARSDFKTKGNSLSVSVYTSKYGSSYRKNNSL